MNEKIKIPNNVTYISAFLTMRCNLSCSFCLNEYSHEFNRTKFKELTGEEWVEHLNKIESPKTPITFSGGEPFMHKDLIYIINNLNPNLKIDLLTNLRWGKKGLEKFISEVNPNRLKRDAPYASIRVSYHPEQMNGLDLAKDVRKMLDANFSIGIWSVLYPSPDQLSSINQMQFICRDYGIDFRLKEFTGIYKDELYGDYSKYPEACFSEELKQCECKTSELLIGTDGNLYRCHRDAFSEENPIGHISKLEESVFNKYRHC